jgi:ABC-type phosphate transport system substrate-binding protein
MSEPLPQDRYQALTQAGVDVNCAGVIGYDEIAFVTDVNNPVPEISLRQMAGMLSGHLTNWSEVGGPDTPIRILARRGSGTTELVLQAFTGSPDFPAHFTECEDNTQCLDMALSTPGSLYWVSTAWLRTQPPRYLRLILIPHGQRLENPLLPVCGTVEEGAPCFEPDHYAPELVRPLYMYVLSGAQLNDNATDLAYEFLQYVRGVRGQAILENHHLYTHFDPPAQVQVDFPAAAPFQQLGLDGLRGPCTPSQ